MSNQNLSTSATSNSAPRTSNSTSSSAASNSAPRTSNSSSASTAYNFAPRKLDHVTYFDCRCGIQLWVKSYDKGDSFNIFPSVLYQYPRRVKGTGELYMVPRTSSSTSSPAASNSASQTSNSASSSITSTSTASNFACRIRVACVKLDHVTYFGCRCGLQFWVKSYDKGDSFNISPGLAVAVDKCTIINIRPRVKSLNVSAREGIK
ncbi:hypothetical protein CCACVL1_29456 [Corchorus capsularis]|uniref:Uncharacterized protein n=1 Tax=Corchorus capsularis TaxID=210143 RepID=A0A1R3G1N2_COCAP|nr:hypothetical protein CCACVL1_29456 [Corchorus capsularis]